MSAITLPWGAGVVDGFRLHLQARNLSDRTIDNYTRNARQFLNWCNSHEVDYLLTTRDHISYFLGELLKDHARTSVYLTLLSLRYWFAYLVEDGKLAANPAHLVKMRQPQARKTEPFSQDELQRMYRACKNFREQAIFLLLMTCGLRRGEVFRIKRDDVNFEAGTVAILGKGNRRRFVALGQLALETMSSALAFEEELCPYKSVEYVWWTIKDIAKRAGVRGRVHPHRFRHTFATCYLDAGATVEDLQIALGHANVAMSLHYAQAGRERRSLSRMREIDLASRLLASG